MRFPVYLISLMIALLMVSCSGEKSDKNDSGIKENNSDSNQELKDPKLQEMMNDLNKTENDLGIENLSDGFHELKYPDGKIKATGTVSSGKKEGIWKYYYENGTIWSECDFLQGVANGKVVSYHPNGQVYYLGYFTNGVKSGKWMFYDKEGKLMKEENMSK